VSLCLRGACAHEGADATAMPAARLTIRTINRGAGMAEPHKTREPAINRENKASAMRLGIGLVVVLVLGVVVWVIANPRSEPLDLAPQHQPGAEDQSTVNQPPAVAPDADSNTGTLDAPPPASSGAGTQ
jgi:hypothetical protein